MSTGNRIHHINLMVDDLARAVEFYGTALGLEPLPLVSISIGKADMSEDDWAVRDTTQAQSACDGPSDLKIYYVGAVRTISGYMIVTFLTLHSTDAD